MSQRFFTVDVKACIESRLRDDGVGVIGDTNADRIDLAFHLLEHFPKVGKFRQVGPAFVDVDKMTFVDIAKRDWLDGGVGHDAGNVSPSLVLATNPGVAEFFLGHVTISHASEKESEPGIRREGGYSAPFANLRFFNPLRSSLTLVAVENAFAETDVLRCRFDEFIRSDVFDGALERKLECRGQRSGFVAS